LDELPETLDATYERTLLGINKQIRDYARRLFQCLVISIRPLRVKELAELFVIQPYGDTTPALDVGWRPEDPEEFILSTCSTLVSIVDINGAKAVQFSHFSVREYLTSDRVANSAPVSYFHILPKPAHNLLVRACLSTLFQIDSSIDKTKIQDFPLAWYAAEHWVDHARFEGISSDIRDGMDYLFDKNKPYFAVWIWLCDVENGRARDRISHSPAQPNATPLYYAALCGFCDLAERLLNAYPQDLNARGGYHETPLHAALDKGHLDIVLFLLNCGADVESRDRLRHTAFYKASSRGYAKVLRSLIDHGADPDAEFDEKDHQRDVKWTALHLASKNGTLGTAEALIEFGADINHQDNFGRTPLHIALRRRSNELVRLLLNHGANLNTSDTWGITPLHEASIHGLTAFVASLLEHRAHVDPRDKLGSTPLHLATRAGHPEVVQLLLDHGADANMQGRDRWTALHEAAVEGRVQILEVLLNRGADPHARTRWGDTPFQLASGQSCTQIRRLLSEHTGEGI
jgi:ankyrin repeat protein